MIDWPDTIGITRARTNLFYNMQRMVWLIGQTALA
jgi:hypothetical protein